MSDETKGIIQSRLDKGATLRGISEALSDNLGGVTYSYEAVRRWLDPDNEPRFSDMYVISLTSDNEDARDIAVAMCKALRPDLIPEGQA